MKINKQLTKAVQNGDFELIKSLLKEGLNIHASNEEALKWASNNGHLEVVKYLVEKGADIHAKDNTALRWAAENGHLEVVKYLLYDCYMKIKKETKDWLIKNGKKEILNLIEKRDLLFKLDKNIIQKDSIDKFNKKVKI